jgi:hypothetical protein
MAQRVVHQVAQVLAPDCTPLFLTDGFREYVTALLTHYGHGRQPPRRQGKGPRPKPRWMPLPQLLYAQGIKTGRRRRLIRVHQRVVFGTLEAIQQVLAARGLQINTAFIPHKASLVGSVDAKSRNARRYLEQVARDGNTRLPGIMPHSILDTRLSMHAGRKGVALSLYVELA